MVYDPKSAVGTSGLKNPFKQGVVLSAQSKWKLNIGNSQGKHDLRLAFSTQNGQNLNNYKDFYPPVNTPLSDKSYRYFASYSFNHPIRQFKNSKDYWGIFGQLSVSGGNPNPVDYSLMLGLGGNSLIKNRVLDKWGVAFYLYSLSSIIDDIGEKEGIPLQNELGLESFYQYWLT